MMRREYKIHPAIGVARLGNSTTDYLLGAEAPGVHPPGPYRDREGRIKRTGARFRVYEYSCGYDGRLAAVREITSAQARIEWRVHLVNRKAAADGFPPGAAVRNAAIADRSRLVIDAGAQVIAGRKQRVELSGAFLETPVALGTLLTDEAGRLIVLGGFGTSRSVPPGEPVRHFANNDLWCDDSSDGSIAATICFGRRAPVEATPARVVVAPPDYAPDIGNVTTLYDVVFQAAAEFDPTMGAAAPVSFTRDVFPILSRTANLAWISPAARAGHGGAGGGNFLRPEVLTRLADNGTGAMALRSAVFRRLRSPFGESGAAGSMPRLNAGLDPDDPTARPRPPTLTDHQYIVMRDWKDGLFEADWPGAPPTPPGFEQIPVMEQPAALDRAGLESCVGSPFFPGIECGFAIAQHASYDGPFRIARALPPGGLSAQMAVPWQADFLACGRLWWPGQRPNSVRRDGEWQEWTPPEYEFLDMVDNWARLGFIVREGDEYVERERLLDVPVG
jgi:hypothetical protein